MATTTPNNGWTVPTSTDYVKDGATAIETLGDAIDASVGTGLLAWQTYAPALANGWANGNGTWTAQYCQIGKTVHARGVFTFGSTTTKSVNRMRITLPVAPSTNAQVTTASLITNAVCAGVGTTTWANVGAGTFLEMSVLNVASTYALRSDVTSTIPATWATGDIIRFTVTYEAA